jgi:hypothetical protein
LEILYKTNDKRNINGTQISVCKTRYSKIARRIRYDEEEGTETIAEFDTEKQALHFMWEYSLKHPETELGYDEWASDIDGTNKKIFKQEI